MGAWLCVEKERSFGFSGRNLVGKASQKALLRKEGESLSLLQEHSHSLGWLPVQPERNDAGASVYSFETRAQGFNVPCLLGAGIQTSPPLFLAHSCFLLRAQGLPPCSLLPKQVPFSRPWWALEEPKSREEERTRFKTPHRAR